MNEPIKRYDSPEKNAYTDNMLVMPEGNYVKYDDHIAEVALLKKIHQDDSEIVIEQQREINKLQARNKKLEKVVSGLGACLDEENTRRIKAEGIEEFVKAFDEQMFDMDIFLKKYLNKLRGE